VQADFSRSVGGIGVFVPDGDSPSGVLRILHSVQNFPGAPGVSRDRMTTFYSECSVIAFNEQHLAATPDIVVPGTIKRMLQLLGGEPNVELLGPYKASDANVRTTKSRSMAYIPFESMEALLGADVAARKAYELIVPTLVAEGLTGICEPLFDFPTVALIQPSATRSTPYTVQTQAGVRGYAPSPDATRHRREYIWSWGLVIQPSLSLPTESVTWSTRPALTTQTERPHGSCPVALNQPGCC
jgi:hypothetical protein